MKPHRRHRVRTHRGESGLRIGRTHSLHDVLEQRHARDELDRVDLGAHEHIQTRRSWAGHMLAHRAGRRHEPVAEDVVSEIGGGLLRSVEAVVDSRRGLPEARELREHVPDPMTLLVSGPELEKRGVESTVRSVLSLAEAVEIERSHRDGDGYTTPSRRSFSTSAAV